MRVPEAAGLGNAKVTISFAAWKEGNVGAADLEIPVVAPKQRKYLPVSPLLRRTLSTDAKTMIRAISFTPCGKTIAAAAVDGSSILLWDVASGDRRAKIKIESGEIYGLAISPDSGMLITPHYKQDRRLIKKDGKKVRLYEFDGAVRVWDVASGELLRTLTHTPGRGVQGMALSPDGTTIAAAEIWSENGGREIAYGVRLWDISSGESRATLPQAGREVVFSPDGTILATAGKQVQLWEVNSGKERATLRRPASQPGPFQTVAFSRADGLLAGADVLANFYLWDVAERSLRASFKYGKGKHRAMAMAFSPDGATLAAIVDDLHQRDFRGGERVQAQVVLWDAATCEQQMILNAPPGPLVSLAFSPDGKTLATGAIGRVLLWDLPEQIVSRQ